MTKVLTDQELLNIARSFGLISEQEVRVNRIGDDTSTVNLPAYASAEDDKHRQRRKKMTELVRRALAKRRKRLAEGWTNADQPVGDDLNTELAKDGPVKKKRIMKAKEFRTIRNRIELNPSVPSISNNPSTIRK